MINSTRPRILGGYTFSVRSPGRREVGRTRTARRSWWLCRSVIPGDGRAYRGDLLGLFDAARPEGPARAVVSGSGRPQLLRWRLAAAGMACLPVSVGATAFRWLRWNIEYRKALRSGWLTSWPTGAPPTELNRSPGPGRTVRVIVLDRRSFPTGYSVTAAILTAISYAVDELIGPASRRTAVVPVALPLQPGSHNNVVNVSIDLRWRSMPWGADVADRRRVDRDTEACVGTESGVGRRGAVRLGGPRVSDAPGSSAVRHRRGAGHRPGCHHRVVGEHGISGSVAGRQPTRSASGRWQDPVRHGFSLPDREYGARSRRDRVGAVVTISVITSPDIVDADAYVDMLRRALDRVAAGGSPQP